MGSFPFADISTSDNMTAEWRSAVRWSEARWRAGWCRLNPPVSLGLSAPAFLPLDDHHDIACESQCTRQRASVAGARGRAVARRLP
jgi:hypothetical protein